MGKRDTKAAKAKRAERRGQGSVKTDAKTEKSLAKQDRRDANKQDDQDIEALLKEITVAQASEAAKEEVVPPPSPRCHASLTVHPSREGELLLFGGEHYDGKRQRFYADLFRYSIKRNEWKRVVVPAMPPPRSTHQAVGVAAAGGQLWVFGGEFSSPNGMTFRHYRDLWCLDLATGAWEQVSAKNGPSARSGHRMALVRDKLLVFGGFFDNLREVKYYNDLHLFDLSMYKWTRVTPEPHAPVPSPRSGFQLVSEGGADGVYLYGGYFKKKVVMQQFDSHKSKAETDELSETGVEYQDLWHYDVPTATWTALKRSGAPPSLRSGFALALHRKRLVLFGGVHDEDTPDGDGLVSEFYNDLHAYSLEAGRWHPLALNAPRAKADKAKPSKAADADAAAAGDDDEVPLLIDGGGRRRNRNRQDEDESERPKAEAAAGEASAAAGEAAPAAVGAAAEGEAAVAGGAAAAAEGEAAAAPPVPCPRMKAMTALKGNTWYVYGGLFEEKESSELTLDDFWSIDLARLDGWSCLHKGEALAVEELSEGSSDDSDEEEETSESDEEGAEAAAAAAAATRPDLG